MEYPPGLFEQGVGGTVQLRLFVDSTGAVVADSTRVEASSGYPTLDSAAFAAAPSRSDDVGSSEQPARMPASY